MDVLIRNAAGHLSVEDREYATKKLGKLDRYFEAVSRVEILHTEDRNQHKQVQKIQVNVSGDGLYLKGVEADTSIRAAIDAVAENLELRLRKNKSKIVEYHRKNGRNAPPIFNEISEADHGGAEPEVYYKKLEMKPMSLDEAILQLEMTGHKFFLFWDAKGKTELLFKDKNGDYCVLSPDV